MTAEGPPPPPPTPPPPPQAIWCRGRPQLASRPIAQGQICIGARRNVRGRSTANSVIGEAAETGSPFASLEKVEVFSARQDATFQVSFNGEEADVVFRSPSGSINAVDGPLAVFHFRLSNSVKEGEVYDLALDTRLRHRAGSGQRLNGRGGRV